MQTILIPFDFTDRSRRALDYTLDLFKPALARYVLLHAYNRVTSNEFLVSVDDIIEKDILHKMDTEIDHMRKRSGIENIEVIKHCEKNDIISAINNAQEKYGGDILIIGSDGEFSWNDVSFRDEGKTLNIVQLACCPTLIIPVDKESHPPSNVLFATLLQGIHSSQELSPLIEILNGSHAHLDILNVSLSKGDVKKLNEELKSTVNGYFKGMDFHLHTMMNQDVSLAIGEFSRKHKNDLICIMYRRHGILEKLLRQSVAKKMILRLEQPILALKHAVA